jgi:hypothetical protein
MPLMMIERQSLVADAESRSASGAENRAART